MVVLLVVDLVEAACKHIGALSYALADFFRIKDAPESLTCTDQLQQWLVAEKCIQFLSKS